MYYGFFFFLNSVNGSLLSFSPSLFFFPFLPSSFLPSLLSFLPFFSQAFLELSPLLFWQTLLFTWVWSFWIIGTLPEQGLLHCVPISHPPPQPISSLSIACQLHEGRDSWRLVHSFYYTFYTWPSLPSINFWLTQSRDLIFYLRHHLHKGSNSTVIHL